MTITPDRNTAVEIFIQTLIAHVRKGVPQNIRSALKQGPRKVSPMRNKQLLHEWFQQLNNQEKEYLYQVIQEAVDASLFSTLVILDGAAGGRPLQGKLSDFALYLQEYDDVDAERLDIPKFRIRLNSRYNIL
jgi:DNA-binding protein Fis